MEQDELFLKTWMHGKSEKTQKAYLSDIAKFYAFVNEPLQGVTLADVQEFEDSLSYLKPSTQARHVACVKSVLSFAQKTGYIQFNVGAAVRLPKIEDRLAERILSEQQIAKMFALETNTRNHAILILLYRAGLREAELCDLQWRHVQERNEAGQIAVYGKGKKTRFVLLDQETWQELVALKKPNAAGDEYVFQSRQSTNGSRRLDESQIHRIVHTAARRAGITGNVSPHWMRHAHATHSIENGAALTLVKETLGHKSIQTTAKYVHVRPSESSTKFLKI
jgi:integrase/recombinase XerD